jgi:hypothetical protein
MSSKNRGGGLYESTLSKIYKYFFSKGVVVMRCWYCDEQLIWGSDDQLDDDEGQYHLVTHLSCPKCDVTVLVSKPIKDSTTVEI